YCYLQDDGVSALVASPYLGRVQVLDLAGTSMTDRGAEALARAPALTAVRLVAGGKRELSEGTRQLLRERLGEGLLVGEAGGGLAARLQSRWTRTFPHKEMSSCLASTTSPGPGCWPWPAWPCPRLAPRRRAPPPRRNCSTAPT